MSSSASVQAMTVRITSAQDAPSVTVEITDGEMGALGRFYLRCGTTRSWPVSPSSGRVYVRLHQRDGKVVPLPWRSDGEYSLTGALFERSRSLSQSGMRNLPPGLPGVVTRWRGRAALDLSVGPNVAFAPAALPPYQISWIGQRPPPIKALETDDGLVVYRWQDPIVAPGPAGLTVQQADTCQIASGGSQLLLMLPGTARELSIKPSYPDDSPGLTPEVISVRLTTSNEDADTIGGFVSRGDYISAESTQEWLQDAVGYLYDKEIDPFAATVSAYLLLRYARYDLMRDWVHNLADWFPHLQDGKIIWACQCLRQKQDVAQAKDYFLRAGRAPELPFHTEGIRLLVEGLTMMGAEGSTVLETFSAKLPRVVWNSPFTALVTRPASNIPSAPGPAFDIRYAASK